MAAKTEEIVLIKAHSVRVMQPLQGVVNVPGRVMLLVMLFAEVLVAIIR
mgnify:CR=1 FL=1